MSMQKARRIWKIVGVGVLTFLLAIVCVVLAYTGILYRESRVLLNTVRAVRVGGVLDANTIEVAKQMRGIAYIRPPQGSSARYEYFYVDPSAWVNSRYATEFIPVSFDQCMSDSCAISFPTSNLQVDRASQLFFRHPRTLLPAFYWIYSFQGLHRWLPIAWLDPVTIKVEKGIIQELDVQMRSEAIDGPVCPRAEVNIRVTDQMTPSWDVTPTRIVHTGGDCGEDVGIRVRASTDATRDQLADALNFNLRCLLPGGYCTECEMLPMICKHYPSSIRNNP
jgi:hypothetical protein